MSTLKYLFVAAYSNELKPFCALKQESYVIENDRAYLAAGIGPVASAFGLAQFLIKHKPEVIITFGTAGTFKPDTIKCGDVVVVDRVGTPSYSDLVYSPSITQKDHHITSERPSKYTNKLENFNSVSVYCPQEITSGNAEAKRLALHYDTENLEAYAFQYVAQNLQIPMISILGISNAVGSQGHKEWLQNESKVCESIALVIKSF